MGGEVVLGFILHHLYFGNPNDDAFLSLGRSKNIEENKTTQMRSLCSVHRTFLVCQLFLFLVSSMQCLMLGDIDNESCS